MHRQVLAETERAHAALAAIRATGGHVGPALLRAKAETLERVARRYRQIAQQKEQEAGPSGFTLPNIFGR